jgi:hypothetical protein
MSDLSHSFCKRCRQPLYCCDCEHGEPVESVVNFMIRKEPVPDDHPFFDRHGVQRNRHGHNAG